MALKSVEPEAWCSWEIPQAGSPVALFHGVYSILLGSNPSPLPPYHHPISELPWWVNGLLGAPQTSLLREQFCRLSPFPEPHLYGEPSSAPRSPLALNLFQPVALIVPVTLITYFDGSSCDLGISSCDLSLLPMNPATKLSSVAWCFSSDLEVSYDLEGFSRTVALSFVS